MPHSREWEPLHYTVTVTDDNGCTGTADIAITITDNPTVFASGSSVVCDDATISLNSTALPGSAAVTAFAWSGPNSFTSTLDRRGDPRG